MSTYKPLSEQIAGRMIMDIKNGTSVFQRPNNSLNSALPFNIESGHKYAGPSALILLMQKRDDPRWATSNQANRNHSAVLKGATGTLINFMTQFEYQKVVDELGEPVLKENGKQRTERVKLEEPKQVDAWLFNGEQMRNMPKWEKEPGILAPAERAQLILENANVAIENGGDDMFYERQTDTIIIPDKEQFASPEQYYAEALHQLAHRTYQLEGFNRDGENRGGEMVGEELRTNMASLFISKELNLPYDLNEHVGYLNSWSVMLKEEPAELFKAASDAQKIVDQVMGLEKKVELQKETATDEHIENSAANEQATQQQSEEEPAKSNPNKLEKGDVIAYKGKEYTVLSEQKNKILQIQDSTGDKMRLSPKNGLYASLLHAKNNPLEQSQEMEQAISEEEAQEAEEETDYSMSR
jgi:antirestriction protein ArdC